MFLKIGIILSTFEDVNKMHFYTIIYSFNANSVTVRFISWRYFWDKISIFSAPLPWYSSLISSLDDN